MKLTSIIVIVTGVALCLAGLSGCDDGETTTPDAAVQDSTVDGKVTQDVGPGKDTVGNEDGQTGDATPDGPAGPTRWEIINGPAPTGMALTATLLNDGRVLVVGGYYKTGNTKTYESKAYLYDPSSRSFSPAGTLKTGRSHHSATLLTDGRVLVVGGYDDTEYASPTVEIYDPKAKTWSDGPALASARTYHGAVRLPNGEVLIVGGYSYYGAGYLDSIAIYDPKANSWKLPAAVMNDKRLGPGVLLLSTGKVLIVGGKSAYDVRSDTLEIYDPQAGTFTLVTDKLSYGKYNVTLDLLTDGRVLIVGGTGFGANKKDEIYDPVANTVKQLNHPGGPPEDHAAVTLKDGRVMVCGGISPDQNKVLAFEVTGGGTWGQLPTMNVGRYRHVAVTLQDGTVLVVGGRKTTDSYVNTAEIFVP